MYLAYDRKAYIVKDDPEIRFTIDENIRSRKNDMDLRKGDDGEKLYDGDVKLLEIKAPGALPLWFVEILDGLSIYSTSFSKYGRVYQNRLQKELEALDIEDELMTRYTLQQLEYLAAGNAAEEMA